MLPQSENRSPLTCADENYLLEAVVEAKNKLESALKTASTYPKLSELSQSLGDGVTNCEAALTILIDLDNYVDE